MHRSVNRQVRPKARPAAIPQVEQFEIVEAPVRERYREDILEGLEQAPASIAGLYRGENLGKRLIRIAPEGH